MARKQRTPFLRPSEAVGAVRRMDPAALARFQARKSPAVDPWGFGQNPSDVWGGTYTHPSDIQNPRTTDTTNPWAA